MPTVYVETSFISACVTTRTDPASVYRKETSLEWWNSHARRYSLYTSVEVLAELAHPGLPGGSAALALVEGLPVLPLDEEARGLAKLLVHEKVMPGPDYAGDAVHIAVATLHGLDYVVTWNVRHLANPNKLKHLSKTCMRLSLIPPRIVTPELLWETDDE